LPGTQIPGVAMIAIDPAPTEKCIGKAPRGIFLVASSIRSIPGTQELDRP